MTKKTWNTPELKRMIAGAAETTTTGRRNENGVPGNDKS